MGGPIGVMSSKFLLKAGLLLVSVRLDGHAVTAVIDPTAPQTTVAPALSARIGGGDPDAGTSRHRRHVLGIDHAEVPVSPIAAADLPPGADMTIGADVLSRVAIGLDLARMHLRVFDHAERRLVGRGMVPVRTLPGTGRCLPLATGDADRPVAFASGEPAGPSAAEVSIGGTLRPVWQAPPDAAGCPGLVVGWRSFVATRVVLDLGADRLWLERARPGGR